jgi:anamorsin
MQAHPHAFFFLCVCVANLPHTHTYSKKPVIMDTPGAGPLAVLYAAGLEGKAQDLAKEIGGSHPGGVEVRAVEDGVGASGNSGSYPKIVLFLSSAEAAASEAALAACLGALAPQGELVVKLCGGGEAAAAGLKTQLLLAGFVNVEALPASATSDASLIAHKPQWEAGATAAVSVSLPAGKAKAAAWKLDVGDVQDDDLIDPDSLLEADEGLNAAARAKKEAATAAVESNGAGGCAPKKRACKNCSCGRAEEEAAAAEAGANGGGASQAEAGAEAEAAKSSACGNCYKGDAFRCAGCPYLGMPAFEPGRERVMLKLDS